MVELIWQLGLWQTRAGGVDYRLDYRFICNTDGAVIFSADATDSGAGYGPIDSPELAGGFGCYFGKTSVYPTTGSGVKQFCIQARYDTGLTLQTFRADGVLIGKVFKR